MQSLRVKLSLVFLALLLPMVAMFLFSTVITAKRYHQELKQKANADIAERLVLEQHMSLETALENGMLAEVAEKLAMTFSNIELYLLSPQGDILASSLPKEQLALQRVDLSPISYFLQASARLPILGDNPKTGQSQSVFSVARIGGGRHGLTASLAGYLYVILSSDALESTASMAQESYVLRLSLLAGAAVFVIVLIAALVFSQLLSRRILAMERAMAAFEASNFSQAMVLQDAKRQGDEISRLNAMLNRLSQRVLAQLEELKQLDSLRRELISNVSHDLRTPLTALSGYLETLELKQASLSEEEFAEHLSTARKQVAQLTRLISELFELSKLEKQEVPLNKEGFSMAELVSDSVQQGVARAKRKDIAVVMSPPENAFYLEADLAMVERLLSNIISNAIAYADLGSKVTITLAQNKSHVLVRVHNTGSYISPEEQKHVFERYYRSQRVQKQQASEAEGLGLGLAICKRIVELHGGDIKVHSDETTGTSFSFSLSKA